MLPIAMEIPSILVTTPPTAVSAGIYAAVVGYAEVVHARIASFMIWGAQLIVRRFAMEHQLISIIALIVASVGMSVRMEINVDFPKTVYCITVLGVNNVLANYTI